MLYCVDVVYEIGCSDMLFKVKLWDDVEVVVMVYLLGKGKYVGVFGVLCVCMVDGCEFFLGIGFIDE